MILSDVGAHMIADAYLLWGAHIWDSVYELKVPCWAASARNPGIWLHVKGPSFLETSVLLLNISIRAVIVTPAEPV